METNKESEPIMSDLNKFEIAAIALEKTYQAIKNCKTKEQIIKVLENTFNESISNWNDSNYIVSRNFLHTIMGNPEIHYGFEHGKLTEQEMFEDDIEMYLTGAWEQLSSPIDDLFKFVWQNWIDFTQQEPEPGKYLVWNQGAQSVDIWTGKSWIGHMSHVDYWTKLPPDPKGVKHD